MYRIYQVQMGENLDDVAQTFDTTAAMLRELNGFPSHYEIREGERIIVPNQNTSFTRYTVKKGDTLYQLAQNYHTNPKELAMLNGLDEDDYLYIDQVILVPKENVEFYITEEDDTLTKVANQFFTIPEVLVSQNKTIYLRPEQLIIYQKEKEKLR